MDETDGAARAHLSATRELARELDRVARDLPSGAAARTGLVDLIATAGQAATPDPDLYSALSKAEAALIGELAIHPAASDEDPVVRALDIVRRFKDIFDRPIAG